MKVRLVVHSTIMSPEICGRVYEKQLDLSMWSVMNGLLGGTYGWRWLCHECCDAVTADMLQRQQQPTLFTRNAYHLPAFIQACSVSPATAAAATIYEGHFK